MPMAVALVLLAILYFDSQKTEVTKPSGLQNIISELNLQVTSQDTNFGDAIANLFWFPFRIHQRQHPTGPLLFRKKQIDVKTYLHNVQHWTNPAWRHHHPTPPFHPSHAMSWEYTSKTRRSFQGHLPIQLNIFEISYAICQQLKYFISPVQTSAH